MASEWTNQENAAFGQGVREGLAQGRTEERARAATIARGAGCLCAAIEAHLGQPVGKWNYEAGEREVHDPRCPDAIAARIEEEG